MWTVFSVTNPLLDAGAPIKTVVVNPSYGAAYGGGVVAGSKRPNAALVFTTAPASAQSTAGQPTTGYKVQKADGTWIAVQLGEQGGVMSEIKSGISAGTALKLMPSTGTESARGTDTGKPTGRPERRGREGRE